MPERTSWMNVGLAVAFSVATVAILRLGGIPSVDGESAVPSLVAPPVTVPADASLVPRIQRLESDLKRVRRELSSLRRDHEALSGWTLQSILAVQGGGGAVIAPAPSPEDAGFAPYNSEPDETLAGGDGFDVVLTRLELFPQQVAAVEPLVVEYVSLRDAGAATGSAPARLADELRGRLVALLTDEQMRRLDEMVPDGSAAPTQVSTEPVRH